MWLRDLKASLTNFSEKLTHKMPSTGIPRLMRFLVVRFHFTQIFVAAQKDLHYAVL